MKHMIGPFGTRAIRIHKRDNVAVLLEEGAGGPIQLLGESMTDAVHLVEHVASGHKIAVHAIILGGPVIKSGVVIGVATADIAAGAWVHTHNCRSQFDERSQTLDRHTGASTDTQYD